MLSLPQHFPDHSDRKFTSSFRCSSQCNNKNLNLWSWLFIYDYCTFLILLSVRTKWVTQEGQWWRICLPMQVRSLNWEDPLEKEMAAHSSILAWKIPWIEKPGRLQFMGPQRVGHDSVTEHAKTKYMSLAYCIHYGTYHNVRMHTGGMINIYQIIVNIISYSYYILLYLLFFSSFNLSIST